MINVVVLGGGRSPEHVVSLRSAAQVLQHLDRLRYRLWPVRLDERGAWWVPDSPATHPESIGDDFSVDAQPMLPGAALAHLIGHGMADVVLPVLHGPNGEDGSIQGMLTLHDVPFVGAGCAASAVAMDKIRTRECLLQQGLPMAPAIVEAMPGSQRTAEEVAQRVVQRLGLPCFVKVDVSGSSLGVARVETVPALLDFLKTHRDMGRRLLAEAPVPGEEFTVAVLGNAGTQLEPLPPVGIYPKNEGYFTYAAKYDSSATDEVAPPPGWSTERIAEVQELALRCHEALVCDGMSRTDMIWGPSGPVILEVNTIPGLTRESLLPKAAVAQGYEFSSLLDRLLCLALSRGGVVATSDAAVAQSSEPLTVGEGS